MSIAIARQLAKAAGLPVKDRNEIPASEMQEIERWFHRVSADVYLPKSEEASYALQQASKAVDEQKEGEYSQRRSERFRARSQRSYASRQIGKRTIKIDFEEKLILGRKERVGGKDITIYRCEAEIPGCYEWSFEGKDYQSWMGKRELAIMPPKSIGGYLSQRYPGFDVAITTQGVVAVKMFSAPGAEPMVVPKYRVFLSKKLPGWYLTWERLLLEGRLLDRDAAKELWTAYDSGEISQQDYSEKLAILCRKAEKFEDDPATGWLEINEKGMIQEMEYDDTRDGVEVEETLGMLYNRGKHDDDAVIFPSICIKPTNYQWEESDEAIETVEDDRVIAMTLGLSERAVCEAEDVSTHMGEFIRNATAIHKKDEKTRRNNAKIAEAEVSGW